MAEIINLRQARKRKVRSEKETQADENRVKFGRTKASKSLLKKNKDLETRKIDSHKRED